MKKCSFCGSTLLYVPPRSVYCDFICSNKYKINCTNCNYKEAMCPLCGYEYGRKPVALVRCTKCQNMHAPIKVWILDELYDCYWCMDGKFNVSSLWKPNWASDIQFSKIRAYYFNLIHTLILNDDRNMRYKEMRV